MEEEDYHGKPAPVANKGAKLWMMFHTFSNGHQIEPYADRSDALEHAAQIIMDYIGQDPDADCRSKADDYAKAREAFARDDYEAVLAVKVSEIDDRCNVEIIESQVQ